MIEILKYENADQGDQGFSFPVISLTSDEEKIGGLHTVSINPGFIRGNHCHLEHDEKIVIWGSHFLVRSKYNNHCNDYILDEDKIYLLLIKKNTFHAFKNLHKKKTGFILSYYDKKFLDYSKQTVWEKIIH